jgi:cellulose synthase/poly-beta-1,6-N-acetylglucosamine synthase-like glycosyltransferase
MRSLSDLRWWLGMLPTEVVKYHPKHFSISVIIPAYNEEASIGDTVESIKNQSVPIDRIIVVDDHSSDSTGDVARSHGAEVVRTHVNQGTKAMAQNYVMNEIDTDLFVTIDGDTLLHEEAIERTLIYFNDPQVASVCGQVIPQKIGTLWERGRFIEYLFGISLFKEAQNRVGAVLVSSGCFSTFRTKIIKEMGGFKQRTMAEDMDLT